MTRLPLWALSMLVLLLGGCATTAKQDAAARAVVAQYLEAERAGRYREAWNLLAPTDRASHPVEAYTQDHDNAGVVWQTVASRTRFELTDVLYADDHQIVTVVATRPDPVKLTEMTKGVSPESLARSTDPKQLMRVHLERTLDTTPVPADEETLFYGVRGTDDGRLYVWLGLDRQFTAIRLAADARKVQASGTSEEATTAWRKVLKVPPDPTGTVAMLAQEALRQIENIEAQASVITPDSLDASGDAPSGEPEGD